MRHFFFSFLFLSLAHISLAQAVDRYPYLQQPTETSVLVALKTSAASTATLDWGISPTNLSNTLSSATQAQKHDFTISGLQPNTQYYYQVSSSSGFTSAVEHFWTAKPKGTPDVSFLHYGDCGYNNSTQNGISALMEQEEVDFAVVAGDVDQGTGDNYDNVFFGVYKNMLAHDCHYTAIGNHDIIANNGADFFDAFYQPTNNPQGSEHYYTFTWGNAKFICLDSNMDYDPGSDQHDFMLEELRCNDHQWLFVFFHHPPWTNGWDPSYYVPFQQYYEYDGEDDMRTDLVPYFEQYGVDFVLNGHSHCYQRGSMNGVEYVISGGAGSPVLDGRTCNTFPSYNACAPNISTELYINQYVRFDIDGDEATYVCIDPSGAVVDSVTLTKTWTNYSVTLTAVDASGASAQDGEATASATGPHPPYSYAWSSGDTTATAPNLNPGWYYVTITDGFGCERLDSVQVGLSTGMPGMAQTLRAEVFPNPFRQSTTVRFPGTGNAPYALRLLDIEGKTVRRIDDIRGTNITLHRGQLPAGLYLLEVTDGRSRFREKVLLR